MRRALCSFGFILLAAAGLRGGAVAGSQAGDTANFVVMLRGAQIGTETVTVGRTATGWIISSSGKQGAPIDLVTSKFEMVYASDWQPEKLSIDATLGGKPFRLTTSFGLTTAISDLTQGERSGTATHVVSARTIVLPANFYGAYEALAARLATSAVGAHLPAYVVPQGEVGIAVDRITARHVVGPGTAEDFRQFDLTFNTGSDRLAIEFWVDGRNRMAKLVIPATGTLVIRDDIASVMTREQIGHRTDDEQAYIPSERFNLAATVTKPSPSEGVAANKGPKRAAVVLVPGSGSEDRELVVSGVPIFAEIALALTDAGYVVVRYDKRGVGQSGGRPESATLSEFADDVAQVVEWTRERKDVDGSRVAIVSYGEGGAVAMLAAARGKGIAAVGLLACPGLTGRETVLDQQRRALARLPTSEADRQEKMALQSRLLDAVITGVGWETVPPALRRSADTPLYKSWLTFDPAVVIPKIDRPLLVLQGSLDTEIPASNADRLEALGRRRSKNSSADTRKIIVPGINHLLASASTGEVDEYPTLQPKVVSPSVTAALAAWLKDTLPAKR